MAPDSGITPRSAQEWDARGTGTGSVTHHKAGALSTVLFLWSKFSNSESKVQKKVEVFRVTNNVFFACVVPEMGTESRAKRYMFYC